MARITARLKKKIVMPSKDEAWAEIIILCRAHIACGLCRRTTYALVASATYGMIALALSLHISGQLCHFVEAVVKLILRSRATLTEPLSAEAEAYRKLAMNTFLPQHGHDEQFVVERRVVADLTPEDWRVGTTFVLVPVGDGTESMVRYLLVPALCKHMPLVLKLKSWTGTHQPLRYIGRPACIHNVFARAYEV